MSLDNLTDLQNTIDILLQQNQHRNIHSTCCIAALLQEYITDLLPILEPLDRIDEREKYIPDLDTVVRIVLELESGEHSGLLLGYLDEDVDNEVFVAQIETDSKADKNGRIEIDQIVLEINSHSLTRCSLERAQLWLESGERGGGLELVLARSYSVERELIRSRVFSNIDTLSYRLSRAAVRRTNGIRDMESLSRIVRSLAVTSDSKRESILHILKGREDAGIVLAPEDDLFRIESIKEGSISGRDGRLQSGDIILRINGVSLSGLTTDNVTQLLNTDREYLQIVLAEKEIISENNSVIEVPDMTSYDAVTVSPNKPPIPNTEFSGDRFIRDSSSRSLEYPTWPRLSQRSHTSDNSGIGVRNSPMRSSFQVRHVALSRSDSKPLGFTIAGGKGSRKGDIGIFIGHIHDNGAASQEGSMKTGDEILEVNGISLEGMSQRKALQTFKKLKQGLITIKLKTRFLESEKSSTFELNNVFLNKTADAGLGLELIVLIDAQGGYLDGIYIQNVREGSIAYQDGSLKRGDQLLTINGDPIMSTNLRKAHAIIGTLIPGEVDIGIRRYLPLAPLEAQLTLAKRQNRLQPIPSQQSMRLEPRSPSYQADNSSVLLQELSQLNSDHSDDDDAMESDLTKLIAGIERANSFTGKGYGSETALRMSREELERTDINELLSPIDTPAITEEQTLGSGSEESLSDVFTEPLILSAPKQVHSESSKKDLERLEIAKTGYKGEIVKETVTLNRIIGQTLGMNVIASSTPQGGILVTSILRDGPAAKQAAIRVGDELLEVNNTSLTELNQTQALSLLSSLTGEMEFVVIRTPDNKEYTQEVVTEDIRKLDQVSSSFSGFDMLELTFSRQNNETLGITLSPSKGQTDGYLQIRRVLIEGLAARDGRLRKLDRLYALDSLPLYRRTSAEVVKLLRQSESVFTLIILRELTKVLASSQISLTASTLSMVSQGAKKDFLKNQKFSGSFEDSLKDIRSNETIQSVRIATKHVTDVSKSSMDGISGYNSEFTNITPASSEDHIADSKQDNEENIPANQLSSAEQKPFNPKRTLFRKRHLIKPSNLTESTEARNETTETRPAFVQQTSLLSVTGDLPRQLVFSGMHLDKSFTATREVKKIKFMKMFKILGLKLSEEKEGQVFICLVATSSPLRRTTPPLEPRDRLISVNGIPITSKKQAEELLSSLEKGEHFLEALSQTSKHIPVILKEEHQENTEVNKSSTTDLILEVDLDRGGDNKLGVVLSGGAETGDNRVYIRRIGPNSIVATDGRLKIGDELASVNGLSLDGLSHREALTAIKEAGNKLTFKVIRKKDSNSNYISNSPSILLRRSSNRFINLEDYTDKITVTSMLKRNKLTSTQGLRYFELVKGLTGLGLSLKGGKDENCPILVKNMQPQGNAFLSGLIEVEDEIVEINTKSFLDTNVKDGIEFLKDLPTGPVRFLTRKK